jgi:hypothetical protein
MKSNILIIAAILISLEITGQISINTPLFTYSQNFNTIALSGTSSILPTGWSFIETGNNRDTFYTAGTGSSIVGDTYSFGSSASTDRALGGLRSSNLIPVFGALFINNSGFTIPTVTITYTGEQWRIGNTERLDRLDFQYSLDADSLTNGTWSDFNDLDFIAPTTTGPVGMLNGNLPENRRTLSFTISGLDIPNGGKFWIRWVDFDAAGSDDGLSIDDFIISNTPLPVVFKSLELTPSEDGQVIVRFVTESELNNSHFFIERSAEGKHFSAIDRLEATGARNAENKYEYTDERPLTGYSYYRIRQVDLDGKYSFSEIRTHKFHSNHEIKLQSSVVWDDAYILTESQMYDLLLTDNQGKVLLGKNSLSGDARIGMNDMTPGIYYVVIRSESGMHTFRLLKM